MFVVDAEVAGGAGDDEVLVAAGLDRGRQRVGNAAGRAGGAVRLRPHDARS